ncbi:MAG: RNA 3'-phosphate cyclase [Deltaproteobacteria bacterium]|nr:RNA 3'-phosphate cyclase [Deltaproteobacteria bacterium]
MLVVDGSYGEGGGQILRTALSLAALRGQSVRIENIRARRPKPGLRPQHLTAVQALARITQAEIRGAEIGSTDLTFKPRGVIPGNYSFDVAERTRSAGSVTLVAQALLAPLALAASPAVLTLKGGTHVPWSPPAHYLSLVFFPALQELGLSVRLELRKWGWYPRGGGEIRVHIQPAKAFQSAYWTTPPETAAFRGLSAAANLPEHVINRQRDRLTARLGWPVPIEPVQAPSPGPGSLVFLWGPQAGFSALGARGKRAETVADEVADAFFKFQSRRAAVDCHLADQIVLYLGLAKDPSVIRTEEITSHLLTNIFVIEQFLGPKFNIDGQLGAPGLISTLRGRY